MKVLVPVKRVVDFNVKVRVKADGSGVDIANVKMSMNPFDEIACEEAIRLKESGRATEVIAVSLGEPRCQETLRTALAMGADRAILVETTVELQPLAVAKLLKAIVAREEPGLVLMGKQAIDDDSNVVGQMLAEMLGWGQGTFASESKFAGDKSSAVVTREVDGGLEDVEVKRVRELSPRDIEHDNPEFRRLDEMVGFLEQIYGRQIDHEDIVTVVHFSQIVEPAGPRFGNGEPPSPN